MPNPNDPALDQQKKDLGAQIDALEQQIADAAARGEDTADLELQLDALEDHMQDVQRQRKAAREQNRASRKASRGVGKK